MEYATIILVLLACAIVTVVGVCIYLLTHNDSTPDSESLRQQIQKTKVLFGAWESIKLGFWFGVGFIVASFTLATISFLILGLMAGSFFGEIGATTFFGF